MCNEGYDCVRIIDELTEYPKEAIDRLIGKEITLISSDHLEMKPPNGYNLLEVVEKLNPIKKFYGLHDLGIVYLNGDEKTYLKPLEFIILSPGAPWTRLYAPTGAHIEETGHPRFTELPRVVKNRTVFFMSCVYLYEKERHIKEFVTHHGIKDVLKHKIPFKFPDYKGSSIVLRKIQKYIGRNVQSLNVKRESFEYLLECHTAISFLGSSISLEAAMLGVNSINIGWEFLNEKREEVYPEFKIASIMPKKINITKQMIDQPRKEPMVEFMADLSKISKLVTS
jgi:hypothetical protein